MSERVKENLMEKKREKRDRETYLQNWASISILGLDLFLWLPYRDTITEFIISTDLKFLFTSFTLLWEKKVLIVSVKYIDTKWQLIN